MVEGKILTLHPEEGKQGVNISRAKYEMIRKTMVKLDLEARGVLERLPGPGEQKIHLKQQ